MEKIFRFTVKEGYEEVISALQGEETEATVEELVAFIKDRIVKTEKKKSSASEKKAKENAPLQEAILSGLVGEMTAHEMTYKIEGLYGLSTSKMIALLKPLVEEGSVVRIEPAKKSDRVRFKLG